MNLYIDSSVLLRRALRQPGALAPIAFERTLSSVVIRVECWRTLDRLRLLRPDSSEAIVDRAEAVLRGLRPLEMIPLNQDILERAARPLPVVLGTLDALHLASAQLWREKTGQDILLATHDRQLSLAARASGLAVVGA
ncbi:MAG TPA: PIN domain-containing protein [Terriglobales bacterium]|nr:PIN domain-containing protein [Terriglobales bacterium]